MSRWLSAAWFADLERALAGQGAPQATGAERGGPVAVEVTVTGAAAGDVVWHCRVGAGATEVGAGPDAAADVRLVIADGDAWQVLRGELGLSSAYMQGRAKAEGRTGAVLDLLACSARTRLEAVRSAMAAATER